MRTTTARNSLVFWLMLGSGVVVVAARSSIAFTIGCYDQAIQTEAAHRLINGLGLTSQVFATYPADISQPAIASYLTWWPPGLSLLLAGLLALNIPLVIALKLLYAGITLLGWFGWASVLSQVLLQPLCIGRLNIPVHLLLAIVLPLFYTPIWPGTDVFLWAGVPFILLLIHCYAAPERQHGNLVAKPTYKPTSKPTSTGLAMAAIGIIVGILYCTRYASIFLLPTILLWLLQYYRSRLRLVISAYSIVLISCVPFLAAITFYNRLAAQSASGLPTYIDLDVLKNFAAYAPRLLTSASTLSSLFGLLNVQPYASRLAVFNPLIGVVFWIIIGFLPVLVWRLHYAKSVAKRAYARNETSSGSLLLALASLPICLSLFLAFCTLLVSYDFLSDFRYYIPGVLPTIASLYAITASLSQRKSTPYSTLRLFYAGILGLFLVYNLLYRPIGAIVLNRTTDLLRFPVFSTLGEIRYFSNQMITDYPETLATVRRLQTSQPAARVFMHSACFVYDGADWFTPLYVPPSYWETAYTSQAISVIWVLFDTICTGDCIPDRVFTKLKSQEGFQQVYTSPQEQTRILVVSLPAGYRFWE